ncbi:cGMP-specific 3p 5p-cyclic phosphodiesterase, partial [Biomphalaria glabrata]
TGDLRPKFDAVEVFALMAACLCHDLDHRGTNNAFQVKVASPLAMLYSTSVLEHHHFDHCIMIINSEGNNIFQSFPPEEYRRAIKILEHAILSTDLALYFKKRGDFKSLVENGEREFLEENKKDLLKAMMMTACDVAAITKPWKIQKEIAQLVTAEFFEQGDIEKTQLGEKPIPMMDREKKDELPKMQVDFIDFICAPVYELFAKVSESLKPLNEGCQENRQHWKDMSNTMQLKTDVQKEDTHSAKREKPKEDEARSEPSQQNCETYKTQPEPQDTALTSKHDQKTKEHVNAHSVDNDFKTTIYSNAHVVPHIQADVKSESKCKKTSKHVETRKSSKSSKSHFCSIS